MPRGERWSTPLLGLALAGLTLAGTPAARADRVIFDGLTAEEQGALRSAVRSIDALALSSGGESALVRQVASAAPDLPAGSLERIAAHVTVHAPTSRQLHELITVRLDWRHRPGARLDLWWRPRVSDAVGLPARSPTDGEVAELERMIDDFVDRLGLEPPVGLPYRIDVSAPHPRVFDRGDLRWGVFTNRAVDPESAFRAILFDVGDVPYLVIPWAHVEARCALGTGCWDEAVEDAREVVARSGYVSVLEGLAARTVLDDRDPAFASGVLVLAHLRRRASRATLLRGIEEIARADSGQARRVAVRWLGEGPRKIDREVQRGIQDWSVRSRESSVRRRRNR